MRRVALLLVPFLLVPAGVARAGGWATVELGETPRGLTAGTPWHATLIVKQHGITPLDGLHPSIRIVSGAGAAHTFPARAAGRPGTYVADVRFPEAGNWRARIYDGFTDAVPHRTTLSVGGTGPLPRGGFPTAQAVMIAIVVLLFAFGWVAAGDTVPARERRVARRRRRAAPGAVA
jgi:hypothetical protein